MELHTLCRNCGGPVVIRKLTTYRGIFDAALCLSCGRRHVAKRPPLWARVADRLFTALVIAGGLALSFVLLYLFVCAWLGWGG